MTHRAEGSSCEEQALRVANMSLSRDQEQHPIKAHAHANICQAVANNMSQPFLCSDPPWNTHLGDLTTSHDY
jgi:hypothetical protein